MVQIFLTAYSCDKCEQDNQSIENGIKSLNLFWADYRFRPLKIIAIAKEDIDDERQSEDANIVTL